MNRLNLVEKTWEEVRGRAKKVWSGLTEDDILQARGDVQNLAGIIERKFALSSITVSYMLTECDGGDSSYF